MRWRDAARRVALARRRGRGDGSRPLQLGPARLCADLRGVDGSGPRRGGSTSGRRVRDEPWTVEHVPLWSTLRAGARRDDHWRFSGLALALAQTVTGPPALLGASAAPDSCVRFGVLEGETLRFGVLRKGVRGAGAADRDAHWAARPFKFSGALDAEVSRAPS